MLFLADVRKNYICIIHVIKYNCEYKEIKYKKVAQIPFIVQIHNTNNVYLKINSITINTNTIRYVKRTIRQISYLPIRGNIFILKFRYDNEISST